MKLPSFLLKKAEPDFSAGIVFSKCTSSAQRLILARMQGVSTLGNHFTFRKLSQNTVTYAKTKFQVRVCSYYNSKSIWGSQCYLTWLHFMPKEDQRNNCAKIILLKFPFCERNPAGKAAVSDPSPGRHTNVCDIE